jgi:RHS repeat-associated protein
VDTDPHVGSNTTATKYLHRDHLGSITSVVDSSGIESLSYDAFGNRRDATDWVGAAGTVSEERGFTGHEHMDDVGIIHMNGRIYDPELGRMLSPDPLVPNPLSSQSWNAYSYVLNNPLKFVDPSGYSHCGLSDITSCNSSSGALTAFMGDPNIISIGFSVGAVVVHTNSGSFVSGFLTFRGFEIGRGPRYFTSLALALETLGTLGITPQQYRAWWDLPQNRWIMGFPFFERIFHACLGHGLCPDVLSRVKTFVAGINGGTANGADMDGTPPTPPPVAAVPASGGGMFGTAALGISVGVGGISGTASKVLSTSEILDVLQERNVPLHLLQDVRERTFGSPRKLSHLVPRGPTISNDNAAAHFIRRDVTSLIDTAISVSLRNTGIDAFLELIGLGKGGLIKRALKKIRRFTGLGEFASDAAIDAALSGLDTDSESDTPSETQIIQLFIGQALLRREAVSVE